MSELHRGSIIQANENASSDWCGCVLIVDDVKPFGVTAFMKIPMKGDAYIRLNHNQFDNLLTTAVLMPMEEVE